MEINCRKFTFTAKRNNADGTSTPIPIIGKEMGIIQVIDKFVDQDDCREARQIMDYIRKLS